MKRIFALWVVMLFTGLAYAQDVVDTTLVGQSIFNIVENKGSVTVNRSASVDKAFEKYVEENSGKKLNGYRIRIFFDNKQTARMQSEEVEKTFIENFPPGSRPASALNRLFRRAARTLASSSPELKGFVT